MQYYNKDGEEDEKDEKKYPQIDVLSPHNQQYNSFKTRIAEEEKN